MPLLRGILPALISGTALIFCFPTYNASTFAWVALVPFLVFLYGRTSFEGFRDGVFFGLPYFFGTQYWVYHSIHHFGGVPLVQSLAAVFLLALYCSFYTGVFGWLFASTMRGSELPALFVAPTYFTVLEYLRGHILTGFPWSGLGYSQHSFVPLIQFADVTGVYGVTFLIVAVNGAIADIFIAGKRRMRMPLFPLGAVAAGYAALVLAFVAVFIYGYQRLRDEPRGREVVVSIIQGSIDQSMKWDAAFQREVLDTYEYLTLRALDESLRPDLIVWPETAAPFYFGADKPLTDEIMGFAGGIETHIVFGAVTVKQDRRSLANSAVLLGPDGAVLHVYDKIHLVPFGEYVPLKGLLFFVNRLAEGIGDYAPGESAELFETPFGRFGTLICYEIIFPGLTRGFFKDGGDFIVNITNDAWFGTTSGPAQHFSMAVFRAVENGKPIVRAANTGISGFIDARGRVLAETALFERTYLTKTIKTGARRTFYSRYGDIFVYLCIVCSLIVLMYPKRRDLK